MKFCNLRKAGVILFINTFGQSHLKSWNQTADSALRDLIIKNSFSKAEELLNRFFLL